MADVERARISLDEGPRDARAWLAAHAQSMLFALGRVAQTPLASTMTAAVLGVAIALPAALLVGLQNMTELGERWQGTGVHLTVFLAAAADETAVARLARQLELRAEVAAVEGISPAQALAEYQQMGGESLSLELLDGRNPLPWSLVVELRDRAADDVQALVLELRQHPHVELVEYERRWVQRLIAIMELGQRLVVVVAIALALAMVLLIGNTIRLEIERRRTEIVVLRSVGGTDAFIRRPFVYSGMWFGILGGLIAVGLLLAALAAMNGPVQRVAQAYASSFGLTWPTGLQLLGMLCAGAGVGFAGAWVAVGRYLRTIDDADGL